MVVVQAVDGERSGGVLFLFMSLLVGVGATAS